MPIPLDHLEQEEPVAVERPDKAEPRIGPEPGDVGVEQQVSAEVRAVRPDRGDEQVRDTLRARGRWPRPAPPASPNTTRAPRQSAVDSARKPGVLEVDSPAIHDPDAVRDRRDAPRRCRRWSGSGRRRAGSHRSSGRRRSRPGSGRRRRRRRRPRRQRRGRDRACGQERQREARPPAPGREPGSSARQPGAGRRPSTHSTPVIATTGRNSRYGIRRRPAVRCGTYVSEMANRSRRADDQRPRRTAPSRARTGVDARRGTARQGRRERQRAEHREPGPHAGRRAPARCRRSSAAEGACR